MALAIHESFLCEFLILHQFVKVFFLKFPALRYLHELNLPAITFKWCILYADDILLYKPIDSNSDSKLVQDNVNRVDTPAWPYYKPFEDQASLHHKIQTGSTYPPKRRWPQCIPLPISEVSRSHMYTHFKSNVVEAHQINLQDS